MDPHEEGRAAAQAGRHITTCPYAAFTNGAAAWQRGWAAVTGAHPLDLTRRRRAITQDRQLAFNGVQLTEARRLEDWPEPLRSLITERLRRPRYTTPGRCRWCHRGVKVPGARPPEPRIRPYRDLAALDRHEATCRSNPDATMYRPGGPGYTVTRDGRMRAWFASPAMYESMRSTMEGLP